MPPAAAALIADKARPGSVRSSSTRLGSANDIGHRPVLRSGASCRSCADRRQGTTGQRAKFLDPPGQRQRHWA
ncbi:hypothetical protein C7E13_22020, partial [Stenotrophomonas maltophilia]